METLTVTQNAVNYMRQLITTLQLRPGARINEAEWAVKLGISRPPLREALRILENEQLVVSYPRRGSYVAEFSKDDLRNCCKARMMIECQAIDFLKEKNTRDLVEVESILDQTSALPVPSYEDPNAMMAYLKTWVDYHAKLVQSAGNSWLVRFHSTIFSTLIRYQFICLYTPGQSAKSREQHQQILRLIKNGKYDQAKKLLVVHINGLVGILEDGVVNKLRMIG